MKVTDWKDPIQMKAYRKEYRERNAAKSTEYQRKRYAEFTEKYRAYSKKYYANNTVKCHERNHKNCRELHRAYIVRRILGDVPTELTSKDIPEELIELKRAHLTLIRILRDQKGTAA